VIEPRLKQVTHASLATVKVVFRSPEALSLWGIPYEMRPDQIPGTLWQNRMVEDTSAVSRGWPGAKKSLPGPREDWLYLGEPGGAPGWFGRMSTTSRELNLMRDFVARLRETGNLPKKPWGWISISWGSEAEFSAWLRAGRV